ncbi:MAG: response regulator [Actinomycetota bacterium]|nr:response regulator [Actinomycetota bacterium]
MSAILIVDDDAVSRLLHTHIVGGMGHDVVQADSVASALAAVDDFSVDAVIADYRMPGATGLDLLDALDALEGPRPPFALITSTSEERDLGDDRVARVDAYLTKPVASTELRRCVDDLLRAGSIR